MSHEDLKAELEQLRKENAAFWKEFASRIRLKVSEKGAVSVYGIRRLPVTLYKSGQVERNSSIYCGEQSAIKSKGSLINIFAARCTEAFEAHNRLPYHPRNRAMPRSPGWSSVR
jgi:hypothetical protein